MGARKIMLGAAFGVVVAVSTAHAVVVPAKAKSIKGTFVTAYDECTSPDTTTNLPVALPACTPVRSDAACGFGPSGTGKYSLSVGKDPSGGPDVKIKASLTGLDAGCEGLTLTLTADFSYTTTDCVSGDCTATADDFPVESCVVTDGKCSVKSTWETFLGLGDGWFEMGHVYNIEWGEIVVHRGASRTFRGGTVVGP